MYAYSALPINRGEGPNSGYPQRRTTFELLGMLKNLVGHAEIRRLFMG